MRQWSGMHDGSLPVGNGLTTIRNVSFHQDGLCKRRPQLQTRYDLDAHVIAGLTHPLAGSFLITANGSGSLLGADLPTGTVTTLATGLSSDIPGTLTNHQAKLYYNDDFDDTRRMERGDLAAVTAGIDAPAAAATYSSSSTGELGAGTYRLRYRFRDQRTGYLSNPSAELERTTTSGQSLWVNGSAATDTKVTQVIWERTTADGSVFYQEGTASTATAMFEFNDSDTVLEQGIAIDAIYGDYGHEPPPFVEIMCEHRGRMFGWKRSVRTRTGCTVASGVGTISGTNFPTTGAWDGRLLTVNSETNNYIIASTTSTTITLDGTYAGTASGSANTINVFHPQPDMLYWSRAGFPESWKLSTWARRVLQGGADEPSAMFSAYDTLWLCGQHGIRTFDYTADPAAARLASIPTEMGVYNQNCIVQADGRTFGFGQAGAFELQGRVPTRISDDIEVQLSSIIDTAQFADFHGCYDPFERSVTWYFTRTGDTVPKDGICYFIESNQWQFVSYRQPIKCSTTYGSATYPYRPYLADTNGWTWRVGEDRPGDCIPSSLSTGVLTTASASSGTTINIVESLPTGSGDCKGAMLYWPAAGEARAIASNTANVITLASAFTTNPGTGVTLYLGSIDVHLVSDWWMMRSPQHKKRVPYLAIEHLSDGTSPDAYVSVYQNLSATPVQWTTDTGDSRLMGVTATSATVRTIDLDYAESAGVLYVEMPDKYCNYWRWTFTQDKPAGALNLMDCQFLIQNSGDVDNNIKPV
jgi:hypothetical protein